MTIRSQLKQACADCEVIFFPAEPYRGMRVFRVDLGKLYAWVGGAWLEQAVPAGKFWFNPHTREMMVYRGAWIPLHGLAARGASSCP